MRAAVAHAPRVVGLRGAFLLEAPTAASLRRGRYWGVIESALQFALYERLKEGYLDGRSAEQANGQLD